MKVETAKTAHRPVEGPARVRCARKEALKQAFATLVSDLWSIGFAWPA